MTQSASLRPPYSQIVILDPGARAEVPEWGESGEIVSTDSCILFACLTDVDGETEFTLGRVKDIDPGIPPIFERILKTPSGNIALETVEGDPVLRASTNRQETIVRIWTNKEKEPDRVLVGID